MSFKCKNLICSTSLKELPTCTTQAQYPPDTPDNYAITISAQAVNTPVLRSRIDQNCDGIIDTSECSTCSNHNISVYDGTYIINKGITTFELGPHGYYNSNDGIYLANYYIQFNLEIMSFDNGSDVLGPLNCINFDLHNNYTLSRYFECTTFATREITDCPNSNYNQPKWLSGYATAKLEITYLWPLCTISVVACGNITTVNNGIINSGETWQYVPVQDFVGSCGTFSGCDGNYAPVYKSILYIIPPHVKFNMGGPTTMVNMVPPDDLMKFPNTIDLVPV